MSLAGSDFARQGRDVFLEWVARRVGTDLPVTPKVLWHYTNTAGLKGILESSRLWATDTRFLNDAAELRYGLDLVVDALRRLDPTGLDLVAQRFITGLAEDGGSMRTWVEENVSIFVACFCSQGDLLSQWRAYAGRGSGEGGYALGFETKSPQAWVQAAPGGHELSLRRVLYDPELQAAECDALVRPLVDLLNSDPGDNEAQKAFAANLVDGAAEIAAWCKHPAFEEEREWRIVYQRTTDPTPLDRKVRPSEGFFVPYVALELPEPTGARAGKLPARHINHGPSRDGVRTRIGLNHLLASLPDFADIEVMGSLAPLRL